jgi:hypothetical protein
MIEVFSCIIRTWLRCLALSVPAMLIGATLADAQFAPVQRFNPQEYAPYYPAYAAPSYYYPQNYGPLPFSAPSPGIYYPPASPAPPRYYPPLPPSTPGSADSYPSQLSTPPPTSLPFASNRLPVSQSKTSSTSASVAEPKAASPSFWQSMFNPEPAVPVESPSKDRYWLSANYLASFMRPMRLASPLVTTGTSTDPHPGAIGQPGTAVLFGNDSIDYGLLSGGRLEAGLFLDEQKRFSLQWIGFLLAPGSQKFATASDSAGNLLLARPIFASDVTDERSFINSFPGQFVGNIAIENKSLLGGAEFNIRYQSCANKALRFDALAGFRYLRLAESLQIRENIQAINGNTLFFPPANIPYSTFSDQDSFSTTNQFFGAQAGSQVTWENRWMGVSAFAKLGLGATVQRVNIDGSTTFALPDGNQTVKGGVLALPSNIGAYNRSVFGLVPEFGFTVGAHVTENLRLTFGYSFLAWNRVVRPGMQYDHSVNTGLAPSGNFNPGNLTGPISPQFRFNDELFWTNNFTLGIELRF